MTYADYKYITNKIKLGINGTHRYAHGVDKKNEEYLVQITHLYEINPIKKTT